MTTDLSLQISKADLMSILASMGNLQEQHPNAELFLEINAILVSDGINYDIARCELRITTGEGTPLFTDFEAVQTEEIPEESIP